MLAVPLTLTVARRGTHFSLFGAIFLAHTPTAGSGWSTHQLGREIASLQKLFTLHFSLFFFSSLLEHRDFLLSLGCLFSQKIRNYSCKAPKAPREMAIIQKINPKNEPQSVASALIKRRTSSSRVPSPPRTSTRANGET